jgi:hypothetical protein
MTTAIRYLVTRLDIATDDSFDDVRSRFESLMPTVGSAEFAAMTESGEVLDDKLARLLQLIGPPHPAELEPAPGQS